MVSLAVGLIAVFGSLTPRFAANSRVLGHASVVFATLLCGAMLEEVSFRGYAFQRLRESVGTVLAIVVLSVLFGAVHLFNPNAGGLLSWGFFVTVGVGVLFAVAYIRSGALWLPFGMHFGWNFFLGVVFGLPVSGLRDFNSIVRTTAAGPAVITGGNYGIEASLAGAVAVTLGFPIVIWLTRHPSQRI